MMAKFNCSKCNIDFSTKGNLNRHSKIYHHAEINNKGHGSLKCPQCDERLGSYFTLIDHLNKVHSHQLTCKHVTFKNETDFNTWKLNLERETTAEFVQNSGARKCGAKHITHYRCHRSGKFRSRGQNKRQLKNIGSNKINEVCTAFIKKIVTHRGNGDARIDVDFCDTHCGHDMEPERLHLPLYFKKILAAKMAAGVSMKQILSEVNTAGNNATKLNGVVTRKHLHNIAASFNLNDEKPHESDTVKVFTYLQNLRARDSTVLWYKEKGEICSKHPQIGKSEYVLAFMNDIQQYLLVENSSNGIIIDSIPESETQMHGIYLTTLMIRNFNLDFFPVAFLFSSNITSDILMAFFQEIKNRVGTEAIKPYVFMSDDNPLFYMAWKSCFEEVQHNLLCSWDVTRIWERNLLLIEDEVAREIVRQELSYMHKEIDTTTFEQFLEINCKKWIDNESTALFGRYFLANFYSRTQQWAYCYHASAHVNTDVVISNWHAELEECGVVNGLVTKRIDRCLSNMMTVVGKKTENQDVCNFSRFKISSRVLATQNRHRASFSLNMDDIYEVEENKKWLVPALSSDAVSELGYYQVSAIANVSCDCRLVCSDCNVCIHRFQCQCLDRVVRFQLCEHIHLISRYLERDHAEIFITNFTVDRSPLQRILDFLTTESQTLIQTANPFQAELIRFVTDLKVMVSESIKCQSIGEIQTLRMGIEKTLSSLETYQNERANNNYDIIITNSAAKDVPEKKRLLPRILPKEMEVKTEVIENKNDGPLFFIINV